MKQNALRWVTLKKYTLAFIAIAMLGGIAGSVAADQIQMQNGDHYVGKVLSLNSDALVLQSDVLGTVRLPRAKVALITLGAAPITNGTAVPIPSNTLARAVAGPSTNASPSLTGPLRQLASNSNLIHQIQTRYLSDAGPEATDKFNELMGGLLSGRLSVEDIRAQAATTAAQARAMRKDLGEDAGWMLDTYLAILDRFVKETTPAGGAATNAVPKTPKLSLAPEEE